MQRKYVFVGLALVAILAFAGFAIWGGNGWDQTSVTRIVPGENGETLVIADNGHPGFFPFFPFVFFIPVLWFLVIGGLFSLFGRRRWSGGPPMGPGPGSREAWLTEWHRKQHGESTSPVSGEAAGGERSRDDRP